MNMNDDLQDFQNPPETESPDPVEAIDPVEAVEPLGRRARKPAPNPLEREFKPFKSRIDRLDVLIMLLIALVYAFVAFVNLGSFTAPQTQSHMQESVILELEKPSTVNQIWYYAGIGEGVITYDYSTDGKEYKAVISNSGPTTVNYTNSMMYVWRTTMTHTEASYIKIGVVKPGMNINEIALVDPDGNLIPIKSATLESGDATDKIDPKYLIDEQNLVPASPSYMDNMYFDEIYHGRTAFEIIHHIFPYEITHPPLGKDIQTIGVNLFGMVPFGWRCVGTFVGVLMLPLMYIMAKTIIKKRKYAVIATILLAVDFMHFAQTRIGTIDSYSVTWIMMMFLFMYRYTQANFNFEPLKKTLWPLLLSGVFFGLGGATKWLCLYGGAGLAVIFFYTLYKRHREYVFAKKEPDKYAQIVHNYRKNVVLTILWCVLCFIVIPVVIYYLSYKGYSTTNGTPWGLKEILDNQKYMFSYHENLNPANPHPFASEWYTWPLDARPLLFYSYQGVKDQVSTMSTMTNPLICWFGLVASIAFIVFAIQKKFFSKTVAFVGVAALSEWVPWMFIHREKFIYHYFAVLPFLILIVVLMLKYLDENTKWGKRFTWIFVIVCIGLFAAFYPVISGTPVPSWYIPFIRWLPSWPFY